MLATSSRPITGALVHVIFNEFSFSLILLICICLLLSPPSISIIYGPELSAHTVINNSDTISYDFKTLIIR